MAAPAPHVRITEPLLKAHLGLWLVARGATDLVISVDGAEPRPQDLVDVFTAAGYVRQPPAKGPPWVGSYTASGLDDIGVTSLPGPDLTATFPGSGRLVGECKGEPTPSGVRSGIDLTGFYTALGQVIVAAGDQTPLPSTLLIGVPKTARFERFANTLAKNPVVARLGLMIVLVDADGTVTSI